MFKHKVPKCKEKLGVDTESFIYTGYKIKHPIIAIYSSSKSYEISPDLTIITHKFISEIFRTI